MRQIIIAIAALSSIMTASAQTDRTPILVSSDHNGWEYEVKAVVTASVAIGAVAALVLATKSKAAGACSCAAVLAGATE